MPLHMSLPAWQSMWDLNFAAASCSAAHQVLGTVHCLKTQFNLAQELRKITHHKMPVQGICFLETPALEVSSNTYLPRAQTQRDTPLTLLLGSSDDMPYSTSIWQSAHMCHMDGWGPCGTSEIAWLITWQLLTSARKIRAWGKETVCANGYFWLLVTATKKWETSLRLISAEGC